VIQILLTAHSINRWLVIAVAVVGIIHAVMHLRGDGATRGPGKILASVFLGLLDLQLLMGVALFALKPGVHRVAGAHALLMLVAIVAAHLFRISTKKAEPSRAGRFALSVYVVPLALILLGLTAVSTSH
jgi:hypothetical protein